VTVRVFLFLAALPLEAFPVWVTSSLLRTRPTDPPGATKVVELAAARREYASAQIILRAPATGLTAVRVTAAPFKGGDMSLYLEHYVYVDRPSPNWHGPNQSLGAGWYPDPLIPLAASFKVDPNKNQPLWLDLYVPEGTPPGDYTASIQIHSDQGEATVPLKLHVWNFDLPLKPSLKSVFQSSKPLDEASIEELLRNKVMPQSVKPREEPMLIKKFGLNMTTTGFWSGADNSHCFMKTPPEDSVFRKAKTEHDRALFLANYTADEIDHCTNLYPDIQVWGHNMHTAGIKNLLVMTPTPKLFGSVDIWVVLPEMYDKAGPLIDRARASGAEIWSYNTLVQDGYSPKWLIDFAPIGIRLQAGFISQSLGLTGLLYWRIDDWNRDPMNQVNNSGKFSANNYPGEGVLVYPAKAFKMTSTCKS
jgi:hypothetical protein